MNAPIPNKLSARGALLWSFAERYASLVISIASTMVLARLLTPQQVGIYSLCAAVTAVAGILRDFGVSEYLIQEKELTKDKLQAAFGIALAVAWSIAVLVFVGRGSIANYYNEPGVGQVMAVLTLNFIILPFASPTFAVMNRNMEFRRIFLVQILSNLAQAITSVTLAYRGHGTMSLAWGPVVNVSTQTALLTLMRPKESLLLPSFKSARMVLSYGSMFVTSRVIETIARNAHEFVIAKQFGFTSVGLFSRAFGLLELFYNNVASAILRVATPAFASDHRAGLPLGPLFARGTAIFTSIAWPFFGFLALMSGDIIRVLFGSQWDAAAPIATILAFAMLPAYLYQLAPQLFAATGHIKRRLAITLRFSPVHLACVFVASFHSLEAVAGAFFVSNTLLCVLYVRSLTEVLNAKAWDLFSPSIASAWVTMGSVVPQVAAMLVCRHLEWPALVNLVLVGLAGVAGWIGTTWALKHPSHMELMRFVKHLQDRRAR